MTIPVQVGHPVVIWSSYGLTGTRGYETAVVFAVRNPSPSGQVGVTYRVTVRDRNGRVLGSGSPTSDQNATLPITLAGNETRGFVFPIDVQSKKSVPASAEVSLYPSQTPLPTAGPQPIQQDAWAVSNYALSCDGITVGCQADFDVTLADGTEDQFVSGFHVVLETHDKRIWGACFGDRVPGNGRFQAGVPQPVSVHCTGLDNTGKNPVLTPIVRVDSAPASAVDG